MPVKNTDLELLVASGVIVLVGLVVWQLALLLTGRRRSFCRDSMRRSGLMAIPNTLTTQTD